ncbi:MAG: hypothetical protein WCP06_00875 [Verrucomicrobiota bacterium]
MRNRAASLIVISLFGYAALSGIVRAEDTTPAPELALPSSTPNASGLAVVQADKLLPFLPKPPEGWTAEIAQGATTEIEDLKLTTTQRDYHKGGEDNAPSASVSIIDFAGSQSYKEATTAVWKVSSETDEGYDKPVEIDGIAGYEHFDKAAKGSSLSLIVAKRYFVQVELANEDPKQLREWIKRIDLKKLAELK